MLARTFDHDGHRYGPSDQIVVVGGGAAGWAATVELRRLGFAGRLIVIGDETLTPYDRPSCCKGLLNGHRKTRDVLLDLRACRDVHWRLGTTVDGVDVRSRGLMLRDGRYFPYDGLVIATGTHGQLPKDWPRGPGMHMIHTAKDAAELRRSLRGAHHVTTVGGGPTGCEVACIVRGMARNSMVVNSQPQLMARAIGEPVGALLVDEYARAGIQLRNGTRVRRVERGPRRWWLELDDGEVVSTDVVVAATGERPAVEWLRGTGMDIDGGVLCDETLRVRHVDGVVAAGSVARWPNPRYGTEPIRGGHWISALEQGRGAANTLLRPSEARPISLLPRFWSTQRDLRIESCGRIDPDADVSIMQLRPRRRDAARSGLLAAYSRRGQVTGVVAVNAPRAFTSAYEKMLSDQPLAPAITARRPGLRAVPGHR